MFKNCEVLVKRIKNGELLYEDLEYIVGHYDQWCYE